MSSGDQEVVWSFGYGSNMDVKALEAKKHVKVVGKEIITLLIKQFCLIFGLRINCGHSEELSFGL